MKIMLVMRDDALRHGTVNCNSGLSNSYKRRKNEISLSTCRDRYRNILPSRILTKYRVGIRETDVQTLESYEC